jgi:hypothetical protein
MKIALLFSTLIVTTVVFAQNPQNSAPPMHDQHEHHMDAMRADIQKLNMSLNSIRASIPRINNLDERNRWEQTIEMWQVLINHMQQMAGEHEDGEHRAAPQK